MFGVKELLLILAFTFGPVQPRDTDHCYAHNSKPYLRFGTKTAYHFIRGIGTRQEPIPHCKPIQIWMMIRHGARYPELDTIKRMEGLVKLRDEIIENHERRGYGYLCDADLENLRMWYLDPGVQPEFAEGLTEYGVEEMNLLGSRIRGSFPQLFPPVIRNVTAANYKFRSVDVSRVTSSKVAFMSGLLDRVDIPDADIPENDTLFASYNNCPRWRTVVANNPEVIKEVTKFREGPEYRKLISTISRRLGFRDNITSDFVHDMWEMCRYDKAWKVRELSPWCAVFKDEELKVLEYEDDLADYYTRGYGHDFNPRLGCPPMQHLVQHFQKLEGDDYSTEPKGLFNFVRSGCMHLFMAGMGFANDSTPPLAGDFHTMDQRQWRTSEIGSFAANVAAVFYKCKNTGSPNKVMFYLAEQPVFYKGCDAGLCDWEYLKAIFPNTSSACVADFCYPDPSAS